MQISSKPSSSAALSATARQVRRLDYDRYLTLLFAPAAAREDLAALYAFNIEIAKTRETVSEALLGQIRLQWWRESIEGAYAGSVRRHEIVRPLAEAIRRHDLSRTHFDALIDARELDLTASPPATLAELEDYAFDTSSRLILLALAICGVRGEVADRAARHVGIAWALVGLMRAARFHALAKRQYVPEDVMRAAGADTASLFELKDTRAARAAVARVAERAREHLALGRQAARGLRPLPAPLRLAPLTALYLRRLAKTDYGVLPNPPQVNPLRRQLAVLLGQRG